MISFFDYLLISEAQYHGNIGLMEMVKFFDIAGKRNPELLKKVKQMIQDKNKEKDVWQIIQDYLGVQLKGNQFHK